MAKLTFALLFVAVACSLGGVEGKPIRAVVNCIIKVDAKNPDNLKCTSKCKQVKKSTWVEGVVYQRVLKLEKVDKMAKITFNKNRMVSCEVVASKTDAELKEFQGMCGKESTSKPATSAPTTKTPKKTEPPKEKTTEAPKTETPKKETTKAPKEKTTEAPKTEKPKKETTEAPKNETPKKETTKAPKEETTVAHKSKTPKKETTKAPKTDAPKEETTHISEHKGKTTHARVHTTIPQGTTGDFVACDTQPGGRTTRHTNKPHRHTTPQKSTGVPQSQTTILPDDNDLPEDATTELVVPTDKPHKGNGSGGNPGPQRPSSAPKTTSAAETTTTTESTTMYREMVCPIGWRQLEDACFYMSAEEEVGSRDDGRNYCAKIDGKLASIRSQKENNFVKNTFKFDSTWIGLTDEGEEGVYKWEDSSKSTYRHWDEDEPNNSGYVWGEDCVEMKKSGYWNDEGCADGGRRYLCRRDAEWYPRTECPSGWTKHPTTGICYYVSSYETNFDDAVEKCKLLGFNAAILVPISQEENDFISNLTEENVWLGLHDKNGEGQFVDENGASATYFNWNTGEPNDFGTEDCVERRPNGKWNDVHCNEQFKFACYM